MRVTLIKYIGGSARFGFLYPWMAKSCIQPVPFDTIFPTSGHSGHSYSHCGGARGKFFIYQSMVIGVGK